MLMLWRPMQLRAWRMELALPPGQPPTPTHDAALRRPGVVFSSPTSATGQKEPIWSIGLPFRRSSGFSCFSLASSARRPAPAV